MILIWLSCLNLARAIVRPASFVTDNGDELVSMTVGSRTSDQLQYATLAYCDTRLYAYRAEVKVPPSSSQMAFDSHAVTSGLIDVLSLTVALPTPMQYNGTQLLFIGVLNRGPSVGSYIVSPLDNNETELNAENRRRPVWFGASVHCLVHGSLAKLPRGVSAHCHIGTRGLARRAWR